MDTALCVVSERLEWRFLSLALWSWHLLLLAAPFRSVRKRSLYLTTISLSLVFPSIVSSFPAVIALTSLFGVVSWPEASMISTPNSSNVFLPISGRESIVPWIITIVVSTDLVWFDTMKSASLSPSLSVFSFIFVSLISTCCGACCCSCLNWYSSIMLASDPLSGSASTSIQLIWMWHVLSFDVRLSRLMWCMFKRCRLRLSCRHSSFLVQILSLIGDWALAGMRPGDHVSRSVIAGRHVFPTFEVQSADVLFCGFALDNSGFPAVDQLLISQCIH